ncbi:MAG: ATP-binding cassette domain-containing protein [Nitrososphaeraceae archaeon]
MTDLLYINNLKKYFPVKKTFREIFSFNNEHYVKAVDGISFEVQKGKVFVLAGESGSGKTTIARLVLRAIEPDSGSIIFDGDDITRKTDKQLRKDRTSIQMVYQDPYTSLNPRMKILDIVMEPLNVNDKRSSRSKKREKVLQTLEDVRLRPAEEISEKFPHMLSGGQRQRVALARSIILTPKLVIADEPVSMLDVSVRAEILELMANLKDKLKVSYLYITHDLSTARYIGDDIAIMREGKIVEIGNIDRVLLHPAHPYTQALIEAVSEPDADNLQREKNIKLSL